MPNLKPVNMVNLMSGSGHFKSSGSPPDANSFDMMSPRSGKDSNVSIRSEMSDSVESPDINSNRGRKVRVEMKTSDKEQNTDRIDYKESGTGTASELLERLSICCDLALCIVSGLSSENSYFDWFLAAAQASYPKNL